MKTTFRVFLVLLIIYAITYIVFRSANIVTSSKDNQSYVIYASEDYVYKLFRPLAYADETLTGTGSHIGPIGTAVRTDFQETGVLAHNQAGMKPGVWYLLYQTPGDPAGMIELSGITGDLVAGDRVVVIGTKQSDRVVVSRMTKEKLY